MRQVVQPEGQPVGTRAHPHGGETLRVHAVRPPLHDVISAPPARQEARGRATLRLQPVREAVSVAWSHRHAADTVRVHAVCMVVIILHIHIREIKMGAFRIALTLLSVCSKVEQSS